MNAWADNPQAAQIDALIERAGRLTDAEEGAMWSIWADDVAAQ